MNNDATAVARLLDCDLDYLRRLGELLRQERVALENRDANKLQNVIKEKLTILSAMESNGRQRDRQLQNRGMQSNPRAWRSYLERLVDTEAPELRATWQALLAQLNLVSELTEINRRLVSRTQHRLDRILSLVRGQNGGQPATYDKLGKHRQHYDNRPITSA